MGVQGLGRQQAHQNIGSGKGKLWGWTSAWSSGVGTRSSGVGTISSGVGTASRGHQFNLIREPVKIENLPRNKNAIM